MDTPILEGQHVRLEPLRPDHLAELATIAFDPSIWKFMVNIMKTRDELQRWADDAYTQVAAGNMMAWVIYAKDPAGKLAIAGGTRFMDIDLTNATVEIGNTWIADPYRGTKVNTESKYLQLCFGFEKMDLERIAFKAHAANLRSQAAIKAIGGIYEGTFRSHMRMPDGTRRDSAWFSIIKSEWPEVKETLERRLKN